MTEKQKIISDLLLEVMTPKLSAEEIMEIKSDIASENKDYLQILNGIQETIELYNLRNKNEEA